MKSLFDVQKPLMSSQLSVSETDGDLVLQTAKPKLKPPSKYHIVMLNDDFTPMDFVVEILEQFFYLSREEATKIMITIHTQGKAICGTYTKDIAETKTAQVINYAQENAHPLMCEIDQAE